MPLVIPVQAYLPQQAMQPAAQCQKHQTLLKLGKQPDKITDCTQLFQIRMHH